MKIVKNQDSFWITNISKRVVSLTDLGLAVQPMSSVNLLDSKHYHLNKEQLIKSATSGSIFAKKDKIVVRKVPPGGPSKTYIAMQEDAIFPTKQRSSVELDNIKYEELNVSDDDYAAENTESAQSDHLGKWNKNKV